MRYLFTVALTLFALPAFAAPWVIDPASTLTFTSAQKDEAFTGSFKKFTPVVEFDPAHPETGHIQVTVDMTSATIADKNRQDSLPTEDWFFVKQFPTATFTSTTIKKTGTNAYEAAGNLTLRGVSKPVTLPFLLRAENGVTEVNGSVVLNRSDFGVGQGQWKTDEWIAYSVTVTYHLLAKPH